MDSSFTDVYIHGMADLKNILHFEDARLRWCPSFNSKIVLVPAILLVLASCGKTPEGIEYHDPHEKRNRAVHSINKGLDKVLIKPAGNTYGAVIPQRARNGVSNFAENLTLPNRAVNQLLQFDIAGVIATSFRFATNTLIGFGGLLDPATDFGLPNEDTDFGETLYTWGVGEGSYVELPGFGPSTARDATGLLFDFVLLDPLGIVLDADTVPVRTGAKILDRLGDRHDFGSTVDDLLYESDDSYSLLRSYYLQARRFELNGGTNDEDFEDPYAN
jgi:phospholipid-binding lipoprotein MlaA